MKEVFEFLKNCKTYYLATVDGDQARVRPFGTIDMFEDRLYIQTGKIKDVSKQIHNNPKVEICAFNGSDWIRISAVLVEDSNVQAKKHMLDNYPELRRMYDENDPNTEVFYMTDATCTISSFTKEPKVIKF